jgi:CO/xanthine dehydrogenase FAD-binding subunit
MDLHTVAEVKRPSSAGEIDSWQPGWAWLAGGTWLFSEPQVGTDTLIDLQSLRWPELVLGEAGLEVAATCTIATLHGFAAPRSWRAAPLIGQCCDALLASFKIWNAATVGGNIVMSLPAGAMIALAAALDGTCTLWPRQGAARQVPMLDFVTGNHRNVLQPGELLRSVLLPARMFERRYAMRHASLTHLGRSAALLVGTRDPASGVFDLTITAATPRPVRLHFDDCPSSAGLRAALDARLAAGDYFDDVHGTAAYKRHLTGYLAEQIREELA